jgi:hypothetical protein
MANLLQEKSNVFGTISSFKTLMNGYPRFNTGSLLPSISVSNNPLDFIIDLFTVLGSTEKLKDTISDIIIQYLDFVELSVKEIIKTEIKENLACNINPSILPDMKNCGVYIPLKTLDMFNLMRKSPLDSDAANFYFDLDAKTTVGDFELSKDFNAFLWYVVNKGGSVSTCLDAQNNNIPGSTWGILQGVSDNQNLAILEFTEKGGVVGGGTTGCPQQVIEDNSLNFKIHCSYPKTLTDFNSDFIDSVQLFDKQQVIAQIFGRVFGSLDISIKRTQEEILLEQQIRDIIDRLSSFDDTTTTVDDSFFTFSNESFDFMLREAELKKNGKFQYSGDENIVINVSSQDIFDALKGLDQTTDLVKQEEIFSNTIDSLIDNVLDNNPTTSVSDKFNFRVNIIKSLIIELTSLMIMSVITPKVYLLLMVNLKMMGIEVDYNPISFIKNNIKLVANITSRIKDVIMDKLLECITVLAKDLALDMGRFVVKTQIKNFQKILQSLTPTNILRANNTF